MAIYKTSNHIPNLQEVDLTQKNTFSCMVNTSGEPIRAYKMQILSGRGDETIYAPLEPTVLNRPIKNKNILKIDNIDESIAEKFVNGKDYQWGVRVYNQLPNAITRPNTLVCDGFLVGSTKYVIWCKIENQTDENKNVVDQIIYDRYIEFDTTSANMRKGAKDDVSVKIPDSLKERRKIDWVTKELGYNKNIIKIETTENFTFNYIDGTPFKIFQCSDEHTLKSFFVDPNSNINISDYVVLFTSASAAKAAHDNGYKPSLSEVGGGTDPEGDTTPHVAEGMFGTPQKIIGYSSDTGEIRLGESYSIEPENGYAYLIFEYDSVDKVCKEIAPIISEDADQTLKDNPYLTQVIGGREIVNSLYTVMTNRWDSTAKRLFIQPNINIKSDDTNPNELVFDNGAGVIRVDIAKQYWINSDGDNPVEVDITFDKLDNTQWLLTTDSNGKNVSGQVPSVVNDLIPPIIPQTDYKVYTDFMDSMPYNIFYARTTPILEMQYKDLNKPNDEYVDFEGKAFKEELELFFLEDETYKSLTEEDLNNENYPENLREFFPALQSSNYYDSILEMIGIFVKEIVVVPVSEENLKQEIELLYQHYNAVGIPLRNIGFNTVFNAEDGQGLKYYRYSIFAYNGEKKEIISKSEDIYSSDLVWQYRGFLSGTKYNIEITVVDEYDKEFIKSIDFNIFYGTERSSAPLGVEFDCDKKALKITATSPEYVIPTLPYLIYLYQDDVETDFSPVEKQIYYFLEDIIYQKQIYDKEKYYQWNSFENKFKISNEQPITVDNIYSDKNSIFDDFIEIPQEKQLYYDTVLDDNFPNTKIIIPINFSALTQFQITDNFIDRIPLTSKNQKSKVMSFGYEYLNVDYYKIKCIEIAGETTINPVKDKEDYPNQNIIYDFQGEREYAGIVYSMGYYIWNGYIFTNISITEVYDIANITLLQGGYYYFPEKIYYDGNNYEGYYLWGDGKNNVFKSLHLFLNSCKGFSYENNNLITNKKRYELEIYEEENPTNDSVPLKCFVTGYDTNGNPILSTSLNLLALGGEIPAPENYKYAIQDNSNGDYYFSNNLSAPITQQEKNSKYRIYALTTQEIKKYLEKGDLPPTEDENGNPYGVYTWNNQYQQWEIEPTEYAYVENVDYLDGVAFEQGATIKEKYDALNVPFNCRSTIKKENEINIDYIDDGLIISPENSDEFSDPSTNIVDGEIVIEDNINNEDNWSIYMVQNDTLGFTATTSTKRESTKREGDLLWTDGDGPNKSNIWVDNSAYSYNQIIATINKVWLTLYLTVTYNDTNPIQCIIKSQEKWEG